MNWLRFLLVGIFVFVWSTMSVTFGQQRSELLSYMKRNGVSLLPAARALGLDMEGAARAFGYSDILGFFDAEKDAAFVFPECLVFGVDLAGTAQRIGLSAEQLTDYAELRRVNDLAFLPQCGDDATGTRMFFFITVWTVGDDFPVAYHVDLSARLMLEPDGVPDEPYGTSYLGYANATRIRDQVEEIIRDEVRQLALKAAAVR